MESTDLQAIGRVYECAARSRIELVPLAHPLVTDLARRTHKLRGAFPDLETRPPSVNTLVRIVNRICGAFLPLDHEDLIRSRDLKKLEVLLDAWSESAECEPDERRRALAEAESMLSLLLMVKRSPRSPATEQLARLTAQNGGLSDRDALLVQARFVRATRASLPEDLRGMPVISQRALRCAQCYRRLYVFGPAAWYRALREDHGHLPLLLAPRADRILVMRWSWMRDESPALAFAGLPDASGSLPPALAVSAPTGYEKDLNDPEILEVDPLPTLSPHDLLPDWETVSPEEDDTVQVEARAFLVCGDRRVDLPIAGRWLVVDPERESNMVADELVTAIEPGMFLIVRDMPGDFVDEYADRRVLGQQSSAIRALLHEWRKTLAALLTQCHGDFGELGRLLRRAGGSRACTGVHNLRNWITGTVIGPQQPADLAAVLKAGNREDTRDPTRNAVRLARRARRRARLHITERLCREIEKKHLASLEGADEIKFALSEVPGCRLYAFCVDDILADRVQVGPRRIGVPYPFEDV